MNNGSMAWVCASILLLLSGCSRNHASVDVGDNSLDSGDELVDLSVEGFAAQPYPFEITDRLTLGMSQREVVNRIGPPNGTKGFGFTFWIYELRQPQGGLDMYFGGSKLAYFHVAYDVGPERTLIVRYLKGYEGIAESVGRVAASLPATRKGP